jgi:hypothetical protein
MQERFGLDVGCGMRAGWSRSWEQRELLKPLRFQAVFILLSCPREALGECTSSDDEREREKYRQTERERGERERGKIVEWKSERVKEAAAVLGSSSNGPPVQDGSLVLVQTYKQAKSDGTQRHAPLTHGEGKLPAVFDGHGQVEEEGWIGR